MSKQNRMTKLHFTPGKSLGNDYEMGWVNGWHWSRNGGSYDKGRDFFRIHWEVHFPKADSTHSYDNQVIRFHVEAPNQGLDSALNELKCQLITSLNSSSIEDIALQVGLEYKKGVRNSPVNWRKFRCTEVFRIVVPSNIASPSRQSNMQQVHDALAPTVGELFADYKHILEKELTAEA